LNILDLILIAFALTSTIFSLSLVANVQRCLTLFEKFRLASLFALLPAITLYFGYWIGILLRWFMRWTSEWIFIVLILIIGIRMISRSFKVSPEERTYKFGNFKVVFALSIALALPALMIGIGFAFTNVTIYSFLISMVVFGLVLSVSGMLIGKKTGKFEFGNKVVFLGGIIFVGLAFKQVLFLLEIF
jgi:manganese efflux pump family protein